MVGEQQRLVGRRQKLLFFQLWAVDFKVMTCETEDSYLRLRNFVSLNSRLEGHKEEKKTGDVGRTQEAREGAHQRLMVQRLCLWV